MTTMNARSARSVRPRPQDLNEGRGRLLLQDPQDPRPAQATSRKAAECHSCSSCPEDFSRYSVGPCSSMPFESASAILNVSPALDKCLLAETSGSSRHISQLDWPTRPLPAKIAKTHGCVCALLSSDTVPLS